jgi:hypothetical protein
MGSWMEKCDITSLEKCIEELNERTDDGTEFQAVKGRNKWVLNAAFEFREPKPVNEFPTKKELVIYLNGLIDGMSL